MTNYKQLCVELLSELENAIRVIYAEDGTRHISSAYPVINKVKNTLAEPEPEDDADSIPSCMSQVIRKWIIGVQDEMPAQMRNSAEWKRLLPLAAGTGRRHEKERLEIILDWMWGAVLPTLQPIADRSGFGWEWRMMLQQRTAAAADAATYAAYAAAADAADYAAADAAANAAYAADYAADACAVAADVADAAHAAYAATYAADYAADAAANAAAYADTWQQFNPCGLLQRLISPSH